MAQRPSARTIPPTNEAASKPFEGHKGAGGVPVVDPALVVNVIGLVGSVVADVFDVVNGDVDAPEHHKSKN